MHISCLISDYNQSINSPQAVKSRLLKYLIPVVVISFAFNVPKFLEATIEYHADNQTMLMIDEDMVEWTPRVCITFDYFYHLPCL